MNTISISQQLEMKNGAHRPILSKHKRRTCSLFCWDWLLFQRKSTGINDVPRSLHILFSWGNVFSCKKLRSPWKSLKVEHTKGLMTWRRAVSLLAAQKLKPSRSFGIDREKIRANQKNLSKWELLTRRSQNDFIKRQLLSPQQSVFVRRNTTNSKSNENITEYPLDTRQRSGNKTSPGRDCSWTSHQSSRNFWINVA